MHAVMAAPDLVRQRSASTVSGSVLGISKTAVTPPMTADKRAALQVFLVGEPGLAKMDLGIDHARQQMQPAAIDHLAGGSARQIADRGETAGAHAEVAQALRRHD